MLYIYLSLIDNKESKLIFEDLYEKYKEATMGRALKMLNQNEYDAEEAFQTAWIQIARNIDNIRTKDEHAVSTYILKTVEYKAINVAKKKNKQYEYHDEIDLEQIQYISDEAVYALCAKETKETITKVIINMEEKYRDILMMYFLNEFSIKEIAKQLGIKEKSVWTRLYRGKSILIDELTKEGVDND